MHLVVMCTDLDMTWPCCGSTIFLRCNLTKELYEIDHSMVGWGGVGWGGVEWGGVGWGGVGWGLGGLGWVGVWWGV